MSPQAFSIMEKCGFTPDFWKTYSVSHEKPVTQKLPPIKAQILQEVETFLNVDYGENLNTVEMDRLQSLSRNQVTYVSATARNSDARSINSRRNDTYVRINENVFGEVEEILHFPSLKVHLLCVKKFQKIEIRNPDGYVLTVPRNHYPFRRTNQYALFELTRDLFIQKGFYCALQFVKSSTIHPCLSFRSNDEFRF